MNAAERQYRRSTLANEHPAWAAPARPDPAAEPPASAVPTPRPERRVEQPARRAAAPRGRSRNLEEARGRKHVRDAAYAWAAAEAKARQRLQELAAELGAAVQRGTESEVITGYVVEACARYGIDPDRVPDQLRAVNEKP